MSKILLLSILVLASCSSGTTGPLPSEVYPSAHLTRPIKDGMKIPAVELDKVGGGRLSLVDAVRHKPAVVVFYRGGWCPFCNLQLQGLRKIQKFVKNKGYQLLAISPDKASKLKESSKRHQLGYTLLSDSNAAAMKAFGIAFRVDSKTIVKYKTFGIDLNEASGMDHHILPVPSVFIVNQNGEVVFSYVNPNYKVRVKPSVIKAVILANPAK